MVMISAPDLVEGEIALVSDGYFFSEGPVWIAGEGLIFSDVVGNTIYRSDHTEFRKPSNRSNGLALDPEGRLLACESALKRITRTEKDGSITVLAEKFQGKTLNSTNDIVVRSDGNVYFTDPGAGKRTELDTNGVYRIDPKSGELFELTTELKYPNGIGLSPDGNTLYVADFMGAAIRQYDVADDGSVSNGRRFCKVDNPDGFAVDEQGNVWTTSRNGIVVFNPKGKKLTSIETPYAPTNCCFGGENGTTLFITMRKFVYKIETKVKGLGTF
jgi:gluconolactonase